MIQMSQPRNILIEASHLKTDLMEAARQYLAQTSGIKKIAHLSGRAQAEELISTLEKAQSHLETILLSTKEILTGPHNSPNHTLRRAIMNELAKYIPINERRVLLRASELVEIPLNEYEQPNSQRIQNLQDELLKYRELLKTAANPTKLRAPLVLENQVTHLAQQFRANFLLHQITSIIKKLHAENSKEKTQSSHASAAASIEQPIESLITRLQNTLKQYLQDANCNFRIDGEGYIKVAKISGTKNLPTLYSPQLGNESIECAAKLYNALHTLDLQTKNKADPIEVLLTVLNLIRGKDTALRLSCYSELETENILKFTKEDKIARRGSRIAASRDEGPLASISNNDFLQAKEERWIERFGRGAGLELK